MLEVLKFRLLEAFTLLHMIYQSKDLIRFWWLRRQDRRQEMEAFVRAKSQQWARRIFERVHCRVHVEGAGNLPAEGPFVVMANHQNKYDIPLLIGYLPRGAGFVAKRELFRIPGLSFWMRQIHCLPLDRRKAEAGRNAFQRLGQELRQEGRGFIIFPEGTRTRDPEGRLQSFRQGALRLATDHDLPIVPVSVDGTRHFSSAAAISRSRRGGRQVRIRIAPPIQPGVLSAPERRRLMEELHDTIRSNREAIRVEWTSEASV